MLGNCARLFVVIIFGLSVCFHDVIRAEDWGPASHADVLAKINSANASERRSALGRLAEIGTQEDVPLILSRLWDDDEMVRGMAQVALMGLWTRIDDAYLHRTFQQGLEHYSQAETDAALEKFQEVVDAKPNFAEVWNRRGDIYLYLGDFDTALLNYGKALNLNPYHFGAMESCARISMAQGDQERAAEWLRRALDINPNLYDAAVKLRELEEFSIDDGI